MAKKRSVNIDVRKAPVSDLGQVGDISIAFEVDRILEVSVPSNGMGGIVLSEENVAQPYMIDHDARWGSPTRWEERFDVSNWGLLFAQADGTRAGSALVAFDTSNLFMLEARRDLAALWDLRVKPEFRGHGVGRLLVEATENWARAKGCRSVKIETQNVNVRACEFYAQCGYVLRSIDRFAYDDFPDETQLIFTKELMPT
jgi:GNAT superfamily N-acetyltransferase